MKQRRYSLEPFLSLTGWTMDDVRSVAPCNSDEYRIRLSAGVTERIADRIALAAGYHPYEVWTGMADDVLAEMVDRTCEACGAEFVSTRPGHRFCRNSCKERHRYQNDPAERERVRARRRRYYAENAEYERARERRRYYEKKGAA